MFLAARQLLARHFIRIALHMRDCKWVTSDPGTEGWCYQAVHLLNITYDTPFPHPRRYVLKVPASLPLVAAAPLLCAGITTYSPLRHYGLDKPGQKLGVVGLGGLGHMAVKFGKARARPTYPQTGPDILRCL